MFNHSYLPFVSRITVWVCLAHSWIILCSIIYVELEGVHRTNHTLPLTEPDLVSNTLSDLKISLSELKSDSAKKTVFKREYRRRTKENEVLKKRREFNDVSKTYVFVLLAHSGIGHHGDMSLQTWQSQLFYIFTMPFGLLFYYVMVHHLAVEIFELDAYATVSIYQKTQLAWTVDQRELYEKFKVFVFAVFRLFACIYLLALLAIFSGRSYIDGVYLLLNMTFLVSSVNEALFPYTDIPHSIVAFVMTVLTFSVVLIFYTALYSLFIMFRYNNFQELYEMLFTDSDQMDDVQTLDDDHNDVIKNGRKIKNGTVEMDDEFWWEKEEPTHSARNFGEVGNSNLLKPNYRLLAPSWTIDSSATSESSDYTDDNNVGQLPIISRETKSDVGDYQTKRKTPPLTVNIPRAASYAPSIEITTPTPSPDHGPKKDYFEYAQSAHTNISSPPSE
ncbi:uncharacterized protein [Clytia hemisphaerica]|uniref:Uncharacterized protein n=1 Tax=Clytia hemisphaerica TaxID=252671 RepID=A0A7M6DMA9_9CNID